MKIYKCPRGHRYAIAGFGEDLTWGIDRFGTMHECPKCKADYPPDNKPPLTDTQFDTQ